MARFYFSRRFLAWPVTIPLVGILVLTGLGWLEADRAQRTAELLMADYATFIAEGFLREAVSSFSHETGISYDPQHTHPGRTSVVNWIRGLLETDSPLPPVPPESELVRYFFSYDPLTGALETSRSDLSESELSQLNQALEALPSVCPASSTIPFPSLGTPQRTLHWDWAAMVKTNARGELVRVVGFQAEASAVVERVLLPLIHNEECACPPQMVPESLRPVRDVREVASFVVRDAWGQVRYASQPRYEATPLVTRPFPAEVPLAGWTVKVRLNPEAVRPLLPYAGRRLPWPAVFVISVLVFSVGLISIRTQKRHTELLRLKEDFVAGVSHELKTPLARVRLFNDLLRRDQPLQGPVRERYRNVIDRECRRLGILVDNVLDFASLERGAFQQRAMVQVDLRSVTEEALDSFRAASDPERFVLDASICPSAPVKGNPEALRQVVINLLDNAVKHSGTGSRIQVRLERNGTEAILSVKDNGPGIPASERSRIFEPFYRARSESLEQTSGSGLGLALVRQIVEIHRGRVWVESEVERGSCFYVAFPIWAETEVSQE